MVHHRQFQSRPKRHRPCAEKSREQPLIRHLDHPARPDASRPRQVRRQGEPGGSRPTAHGFGFAIHDCLKMGAGLLQDAVHHRPAPRGTVAGQDGRADRVNGGQTIGQCSNHRRRQAGHARHTRQRKDARRARIGVKCGDPGTKPGVIGQIEVIHALRDGRARQAVGVCSIGVKRSRRIDHHIRGQLPEWGKVGGAVQHQPGAPQISHKLVQSRRTPPNGHNLMPVPDQQSHQPFAEHASAADDCDLHPISRARNAGSGMAQMSPRPNSA